MMSSHFVGKQLRLTWALLLALFAQCACWTNSVHAQVTPPASSGFTFTSGASPLNTVFNLGSNWITNTGTNVAPQGSLTEVVSLTFGARTSATGASAIILNNDITDLWANVITFTKQTAVTATTPNYTINGNAITMTGSNATIQLLGQATLLSTSAIINTTILMGQSASGFSGLQLFSGASNTSSLVFNGMITATSGQVSTLTLGGTSTAVTNIITGAITDNLTSTLSIVKTGLGTWTLTGANTFAGNISVNGGLLRLGTTNALFGTGANGNISISNATISFVDNATAFNVGKGLTINGTSSLSSDGTSTAAIVNYTGAVATAATSTQLILAGTNTGVNLMAASLTNGAGPGLNILKSGAGSWALTASNNISGVVTIAAGALQTAFGGNALGAVRNNTTGTNVSVIIQGGGVLESAGSITNDLGIGAGKISLSGSSGFSAYGGALNLSLSNGANLTWSSSIAGGFLVGATSLLQFGSANANDVVTLNNNIDLGNLTRTVSVANNANSANDYAVLAGNLTGGPAAFLTVQGTGTLVLQGNNTYTGGTTLGATATVLVGNANALSTATLYSMGGTLQNTFVGTLSNPINLTNAGIVLTGTQTLTLGGGVIMGTGRTITFNQSGGASTFLSGGIVVTPSTAVQALTLAGSGTGVIVSSISQGTGSNFAVSITNTGGITYLADMLYPLTTTLGANARLQFGDVTTSRGRMTGTVFLTAGAQAIFRYSDIAGFALTTTASLTGAGGVVVNSPATGGLTLSQANFYSGGTTISSGYLRIATANALPITSSISINTTGTLDLFGNNLTLATLTSIGTGGVVTNGALGASTLTVGTGAYNGTIRDGAGTLGLVKSTAGALTLSGINSFSGLSSLLAGTLVVTDSRSLGSATWVLGGGTIVTGGSDLTITNAVQWTGTQNFTNANVITFSSGIPLLVNGNVSVTNTSPLGAAGVVVNDELRLGGDLTLSGGYNVTLNSFISLTGNDRSLIVTTTTGGNTLNIVNGIRLTATGDTTGPHVLTFNGTQTMTVGSVISDGATAGGGIRILAGGVTLTSDNTFSGMSTLAGGILNLGAANAMSATTFVMTGGTISAVYAPRTVTSNLILGGTILFGNQGQPLTFSSGTAVQVIANTTLSNVTNTIGFVSINDNIVLAANLNINGSGGVTLSGNVTLTAGDRSIVHNPTTANPLNLQSIFLSGAGESTAHTLTFGGAQQINVRGSISDSAGSGGTGGVVVLSNTGTIVLSNNNYSGGTSLRSGTIAVSGNTAFGSGSIVATGGAIRSANTLQTFTVGNNINIAAAGTLTLTANLTNTIYLPGIISGPGSLNIGGTTTAPGAFVLTNSNGFSGPSTISGGVVVQIGHDRALGDALWVISGGTLRPDIANRTITNELTAGASFTLGGGALTLTAAGPITVSGAAVIITAGGSVQNVISNTIYLGNATTARNVVLSGAATNTLLISGPIVNGTAGAGGVTYTGANFFVNGVNTYSGGTTISGGRVNISSSTALGTSPILTFSTGTLVAANDLSLTNDILVSGVAGLSGAGSLTINGNVTLSVATAGFLVSTTSNTTTFNGKIFLGNNATGRTLTLGGTAAGINLVLNESITSGTGGTGGAVAFGLGNIYVNGVNSYSGGTTLAGGNVFINAMDSLSTGTIYGLGGTLINGVAGVLNNTVSLQAGNITFSGTQTLTIANGILFNVNATRVITNSNTGGLVINDIASSVTTTTNNVTLAGSESILFKGQLIQSGTMVGLNITNTSVAGVRLLGNNAYTGGTTVGTGSTLRIGDGTNATSNLASSGLNIATGGKTVFSHNGMVVFTPVIQGAGSIEIDSTNGGLQLNAANSFGGVATITNGTLKLNNAQAITVTSQVAINSTGTLDVNGFNVGITTISDGINGAIGGGRIVNSAGTSVLLTLTQGIFSGVIHGTDFVGVNKQGAGTLTLSNANLFSALSTLSAGTVVIGNNQALGTGSWVIGGAAGGTLRADGADRSISNRIDVANTLNIGGVSTLSLGGNMVITGSGNRTISSNVTNGAVFTGTVALSDAAPSGSSVLNISGSGAIAFRGIISDGVTGSGSLNITNTGGVTLAAQNVYTGPTTLGTNAKLIFGANSGVGSGPISTGSLNINGVGAILAADDSARTVNNDIYLTANLTGSYLFITGTKALNLAGTMYNTTATTNKFISFNNSGGTTIANYVAQTTLPNTQALVLQGNQSVSLGVFSNGTATTALLFVRNTGGTTYLTGNSTYNGATTIDATFGNGVVLSIGSGGSAGDLGAGAVWNGGGTILFNRNNAYSQRGIISGTGNVVFTGGGTYTFDKVNLWSGGTTISGGANVILAAASTATTGPLGTMTNGLTISGSAGLQSDATPRTISHVVTLAGDLVIGGTQALTFSSDLNQTGADRTITLNNSAATTFTNFNLADRTLTVAGTGTALVSGSITGTGASGSLLVTGNLALAGVNTFGGYVTVNGSGRVQIGNGGATGSLLAPVNLLSAGSVLAFNRTGNYTYTSDVDGLGMAQFLGNAVVSFGNAGSTYSGGTTLAAGTLLVGATEGLGTGTLYISAGTTVGADFGSQQISNRIQLDANLSMGGTQALTYGGIISGANNITIASGTHTLSNSNTYAGVTTITGGTLGIANNNALSSGALLVNGAGAIIQAVGVPRVITNAITLTTGFTVAGSTDITFSTQVLAGVGAKTITVNNTGVTTFSGYSMGTSPNTSALTLSVGAGANVVIGPITRASVTSASLTLTGGLGTIRLTGTNNYNGATAIGGDVTVFIDGGTGAPLGGRINPTTALTMANNSVLVLTNALVSVTSIAGTSANVITGSGATTNIFTVNGAGTFGGVIAGNLAVSKLSSGVLTLTNDNTFTGPLTIGAGTVNIGAGGASGSLLSTTINNASTLVFNRTGDSTYAGALVGTGTVTFTSPGTASYNLSGANTWSGATTVGSNVTVTVGNSSTLGNGGVSVLQNARLHVSGTIGTGAVSLANGSALSGSGRVLGTVTAGLGSDVIIGTVGGNVTTLTLGGLVLNGGTLNYDIDGANIDLLRVISSVPSLTLGSIQINVLNTPSTSSYLIMTGYTGTINPASLAGITINGLSGFGVSFNNQANNLYLTLNAVTTKTWLGTVDNIWDVGTTTNWTANGTNTSVFNSGDAVVFGDSGANTAITVSNNGLAVVPTGVLVVNSAVNYSFTGDPIGGANGLTKQGSGVLALLNNNTFTGGVVISSGTLQLGNGGATGSIVSSLAISNDALLLVNRSGSITLAGGISGTGSLLKNGTGTLVLSGTNNYQGNTTVSGGTLQVTLAAALPNFAGSLISIETGTLDLLTTTNALTLTNVNVGSGGVVAANNTTGAVTLVTVTNNGLLTANNGSVFSTTITNGGTIVVNAGITQVTTLFSNGTISVAGGNLTVGTLTMTDGSLSVTGGNMTVTTQLNIGSGLASANPQITVSSGRVLSLGAITYTSLAGDTSGASISGDGQLSLGAARLVNVADGADDNDLTFGLAIVNVASAINKTGLGTLYLTGSNASTALNTLAQGTLAIGGADVLGSNQLNVVAASTIRADGSARTLTNLVSQRAQLNITGSSNLTLTNLSTIGSLTLNVNNAGVTTISNWVLAFTGSASTQMVTGTGTINFYMLREGGSTGNDAVTFNGTGVYNLLGANTMSGVTSIRSGTVVAFDAGAFGPTPAQAVLVGAAAATTNASLLLGTNINLTNAITVVGTSAGSVVTLGGSSAVTSTFSGNIALGANTFLTATNGGSVYFTGNLSSTGGITKNGAGLVVLTGNNTNTGATTVSAGTLRVGSATAFNAGATNLRVNSGATFDLNGFAVTVTNLNDGPGGGGTITSGSSGPLAFTVNGGVFSGIIQDGSGVVSLNKQTTGSLVLTGTNTYTGETTVAAGTLQLGNGGASGSIASLSVVNSGTVIFNRSNDETYGGVISGAGQLIKIGAGTLTFTNDQTYSGLTSIVGGRLQLGNGGAFGSLASASIVNSGTLAYNRSTAHTVTGSISGGGAVEILGTGPITFTGNQLYTGGTYIGSGATLQLGNNTAAGSVVGSLVNDGTLIFKRSDSYTFTGVVSGNGGVQQSGSGLLTFTGDQTYLGTTTIDVGTTLQLGNGGNSGGVAGAIVNQGDLIVNRSGLVTLTGAISGGGDLIKAGSGTLVLLGNSTYNGDTSITGGVLQMIGDNASANINVGTSLLQFNPSGFQTISGNIAGTGALQKIGSGTTHLTGNHTFNGVTTVDGGTLLVDSFLGGSVYVNAGYFTGTGASAANLTISGGSATIVSQQTGNINLNSGSLTVLSGGSTTGAINVAGGTFLAATGASIGNTLGIQVTGGSITISSGAFVLGNGTTTVGGGGGPAVFTANGTVSGMVVVTGNGTLKGTGTVGGIDVNGGTLSVGNSVGGLDVDGNNVPGGPVVTINGGSTVLFEFNNATGTAGNSIAGQGGWDYVDTSAAGILNITATTTSPAGRINLDIDSWLVNNTGPGAAINFMTQAPTNPTIFDWLFIRAGTANVTGLSLMDNTTTTTDLSAYFNIDDSGVFSDGGGPFNRPNDRAYPGGPLVPSQFTVQWKTTAQGTGLYIHFQAVPEPSSMILAGLASLGAGWYGRRRKRREAAQAETTTAGNDEAPNA